MTGGAEAELVAECLWPDVSAADLADLEGRIAEACAAHGQAVRYLGSLFMPQDEVVLCRFAGPLEAVREVALAAQVPFGRLLEAHDTKEVAPHKSKNL